MQVSKNVNASEFMAVGNVSGKNSIKADKGTQSDFASFLTTSSFDTGVNISDTVKQMDSKNAVEKHSQHESSDKGKNDSKLQKIDNDSVKRNFDTHSDKSVKNEGVDDINRETDSADEDEVLEVLGNVLQQIMDWFGLTKKDLEGKLQEAGLEMLELLLEDGQKSFFLFMNSAEVSGLVVDENLNQDWKQFSEMITDLVQQSDITLSDMQDSLNQKDSMTIFDVMSQMTLSEKMDEEFQYGTNDAQELFVQTEEPEVVVLDQRDMQSFQDKDGNAFNQNQRSDSQLADKTTVTAEKKAEGKHTNPFENPILQTVEQFVDAAGEISAAKEGAVSGREVISQIVEQVRIQLNQENTSLEMQLYPEHLGKIQIHVISKDGVLTARILAETEAAKQAVEGGLTSLKESMENQNLKVEAIEVMVSTAGFERGDQDNQSYEQRRGNRSGKRIHIMESDEKENVEDSAEIEKMKHTGSSVSYTA